MMNKEEILAMPAGRELDRLIAVNIMGEKDRCLHSNINVVRGSLVICAACGEEFGETSYAYATIWPTNYSTDIAAAWPVVEKITKSLDELFEGDKEIFGHWTLDRLGFDCCKDGQPDADGCHGQWRCYFSRNVSEDVRDDIVATADTAPLAICRAALLSTINNQQKEK